MADESAPAAVYVAFPTFKNSIEFLSHGVPNQVDRSTFPGLSGGVQTQLLSGLRFLGLITPDNKPTDALHALAVPDEAARKAQLRTVLQHKYADLFALDLSKTTPDQLSKTMGESYNVMGDTREKAIRFFLAAAQYVGIHLSRFLAKPQPGAATNGNRTQRTRRSAPRSRSTSGASAREVAPQSPGAGTSRVVELKSGGTLTLAATLDLFALTPEDRKFVFYLIDKLEDYAKTNDSK
jgi:hypothetical protein